MCRDREYELLDTLDLLRYEDLPGSLLHHHAGAAGLLLHCRSINVEDKKV